MQKPVESLSEREALDELKFLSSSIKNANKDYHTYDSPRISDAEFDQFKQRNMEIEKHFPHLKLEKSAGDDIGGPLLSGFSKITHQIRMLSLGNAFNEGDVVDFD